MPFPTHDHDDEQGIGSRNTHTVFGIPMGATPVVVPPHNSSSIFCAPPFFAPLLFDNTDSDARDHCANERTFLSYLRLSIYMAIVSIAIVVSFHLKSQPSRLELRMAKPLGIIFWLLSLSCLALGFGNYIKTVNKYSRRVAIVQTGWKTQSVLTVIAFSIVAVCVLFLATNSKRI
ncbi:hypothetical protein WAI453_010707 [Rhynchosporium graminicola]|uniref:Related to DUF domain protein n=2 Tax=Rhynchosporium TaxID=38037 RepID=A0A1E1M8H8_RHYSE|nr:related to DUF domain protein [Rhynchosporium commune]CZT45378.1 related to DUF domain protein [Rhynchosporium secalis]